MENPIFCVNKHLKIRKHEKFYCVFEEDAFVSHAIFGDKICNDRVGFPIEIIDIIYLLQQYSNNMLNRIIKSSKIIFMDTGLCTHLCGWSSQETLENPLI